MPCRVCYDFNGCPVRTLRLELPWVFIFLFLLDEVTVEAVPFMIVMKKEQCHLTAGLSGQSLFQVSQLRKWLTPGLFKLTNWTSQPTNVQLVSSSYYRSVQRLLAYIWTGFTAMILEIWFILGVNVNFNWKKPWVYWHWYTTLTLPYVIAFIERKSTIRVNLLIVNTIQCLCWIIWKGDYVSVDCLNIYALFAPKAKPLKMQNQIRGQHSDMAFVIGIRELFLNYWEAQVS